jgi:ammonia channel protein AmtB
VLLLCVVLQVYPIYTVVVTALVHPLLVHWIWVDSSWLNTLSSCRVLDFAGGLAVHALGEHLAAAAAAAAAGTYMLSAVCEIGLQGSYRKRQHLM